MSWETYRRRARILDEVLEDVAAHGNCNVPDQWRPEAEAMFGGDAELVLALYPRWFAALSARLDEVLADLPADLPEAAAQAAGELARERPALFALLSAYAEHPVMEAARRQERRHLYWAPGAQLTALAARLQPVAA